MRGQDRLQASSSVTRVANFGPGRNKETSSFLQGRGADGAERAANPDAVRGVGGGERGVNGAAAEEEGEEAEARRPAGICSLRTFSNIAVSI